jgi:hypothetical protein
MATYKTGGSLGQKVLFVGGVMIATPYVVDCFWAWLEPKLPVLITVAVVFVVLAALLAYFVGRVRRNAAR